MKTPDPERFLPREEGGTSTREGWRPRGVSARVLTLLGADPGDYTSRNELVPAYYLVVSAALVAALSLGVTYVAVGVVDPGLPPAARGLVGAFLAGFVLLIDLWSASWQPEPSPQRTVIDTKTEPAPVVVPAYPSGQKYLALLPRIVVSLLVSVVLGTLAAIAINADDVEQERRVIAADQAREVATATDATFGARLDEMRSELTTAERRYADAREVEEDANLRTKCEAGEIEGSYRGVTCVPGGAGLQQAVAVRQDARESLARASAGLAQARANVDELLDQGPPSEQPGFEQVGDGSGLDLTIKAWWSLAIGSTDDRVLMALMVLPHLFIVVLDLSTVFIKLLRGVEAPERRRWNRLHLELAAFRRSTLRDVLSADAAAAVAAAADRAVVEAARSTSASEPVEPLVLEAIERAVRDRVQNDRDEGSDDVVVDDERNRDDARDREMPHDLPWFRGSGESRWLIGPMISGPGDTGRGVQRSAHPVHLAVRAFDGTGPARIRPDLDVRVVKVMGREEALQELSIVSEKVVGALAVRPESDVLRVEAAGLLPNLPCEEPYVLVMPYYPRSDAQRFWVAADGPGRDTLSYRAVGETGVALLDALEPNWARGLVHGDVKLANLIVSGRLQGLYSNRAEPDPSSLAAMLLLTDWAGAAPAGRGLHWGTLSYVAPEVARSAVRSFATDSFALGSSLFALLVGATPNSVVVGVAREERRELDDGWPEQYAGVWRTSLQRVMPSGTPAALRELVMDLIHPDPLLRLHGGTSESREVLRRRIQTAARACRDAGLVGPYAVDTSSLAPSPGWTQFRSFFAEVGYATEDGEAPDATRPMRPER